MTVLEDNQCNEAESRYLSDFIHYKKLDEELRYFRENAHEESESGLPFPYLTL
jgi:hypothetical protein